MQEANLVSKLRNYNIKLDKSDFLKIITKLYDLNHELFIFLKDHNISGYESDVKIGIASESYGIVSGQGTNPLLWELGHICYFFEYHCFKNIEPNYKFYIDNGDLYDSFKTDRSYRFKFKPHSKELLFNYFEYVFKKLIFLLNNNQITKTNNYLFLLSILHNHMHCESFIFTKKLLGYKDKIWKPIKLLNYKKINFDFIKIPGGKFRQGTIQGENLIAFDNEMPQFMTSVEDFYVSKYCVTEAMVREFILDNGYLNQEYWSLNGWRWIEDNSITMPFYWIKYDSEKFYIIDHDEKREVSETLPACHISWYEAEAICNWLGGRLPTESEWEYLATDGGTSIKSYPDIKDNANLDYSGNICSVNKMDIYHENKYGVKQLFGNVWEWCQESIYPYDGFKIDPVYKEFSYPFFGFKKILKGGSWASPSILINPRYRNAQMPDCRIQFTGIRVVKNI